MALTISSAAFADQEPIPRRYTADGKDVAPPLAIEAVPPGTRSLVLVVDDPDAPKAEPFVHWVVYDVPPATHLIGGGAASDTLPAGASEGMNDFGKRGYAGPQPPSGRHHYHFKLYALDTVLGATRPLTKGELDARIRGHVLETAELVGTYAHGA